MTSRKRFPFSQSLSFGLIFIFNMADIYIFTDSDEDEPKTETIKWTPFENQGKSCTKISEENSEQSQSSFADVGVVVSNGLGACRNANMQIVNTMSVNDLLSIFEAEIPLDKINHVYRNPLEKFIACYEIHISNGSDHSFTLDDQNHARLLMGRILYDTLLYTVEHDVDSIPSLAEKVTEIFKYKEDGSLTTEVMEQVPQIVDLCQTYPNTLGVHIRPAILPNIIYHLFNSTFEGRNTTQAALLVLLEQNLVEEGDLFADLIPAIMHYTEYKPIDDEQLRVEAATVITKMCPLLGSDFTRTYLLERITMLCGDTNHNVRRVCVSNYVEVCKVLDQVEVDYSMVPIFIKLCNDPNWSVRKRCIEVFVALSNLASTWTRKDVLTPHFLLMLDDKSSWVSLAAFNCLGPFISTFADPSDTLLHKTADGSCTVRPKPLSTVTSPEETPEIYGYAVSNHINYVIIDDPIYNEVNFWKMPLPDIELSALDLEEQVVPEGRCDDSSDEEGILSDEEEDDKYDQAHPEHRTACYNQVALAIQAVAEIEATLHDDGNRTVSPENSGDDQNATNTQETDRIELSNEIYSNLANPSDENNHKDFQSSDILKDAESLACAEGIDEIKAISHDDSDHIEIAKHSDDKQNANNLIKSALEWDLIELANEIRSNLDNPPPDAPVQMDCTSADIIKDAESVACVEDIAVSEPPVKFKTTPRKSAQPEEYVGPDREPLGNIFINEGVDSLNNMPVLKSTDNSTILANCNSVSGLETTNTIGESAIHSADGRTDNNDNSIAANNDENVIYPEFNDNEFVDFDGKTLRILRTDGATPFHNGYVGASNFYYNESSSYFGNDNDHKDKKFGVVTLEQSEHVADADSDEGTRVAELVEDVVTSDINGDIIGATSSDDEDEGNSFAQRFIRQHRSNSGKSMSDDDRVVDASKESDELVHMLTKIISTSSRSSPEKEENSSDHSSDANSSTDTKVIGLKEQTEKEVDEVNIEVDEDFNQIEEEDFWTSKDDVVIKTWGPSLAEDIVPSSTSPMMSRSERGWNMLPDLLLSSGGSYGNTQADETSKQEAAYEQERKAYEALVAGVHSQDIVPEELLKSYVMMVYPTGDRKEEKVQSKVDCAFSLPAVTLTIGRQHPDIIIPTFKKLAFDENWKVRRTLAASIHEIAFILGEETADNFLLAIYTYYIHDVDAVRNSALRSLSGFMRALSPAKAKDLLPYIASFHAFNLAENWRAKLSLAEQLGEVADLVSRQECFDFLCPVIVELAQSRAVIVRRNCYAVISKLVQILYCDSDQYLVTSFIQPFVTSSSGNAWWQRQNFVFIAHRLISDKCVPLSFWCGHFFHGLIGLANDKVPNVRMAVAKALVTGLKPLDYFRRSLNEYGVQVQNALDKLITDSDQDVRHACRT